MLDAAHRTPFSVSHRAAERYQFEPNPGALPLTIREPWMDLDDLDRRHQIELFLAENASGAKARATHRALLADYALRIAAAKRERAQPGMFA